MLDECAAAYTADEPLGRMLRRVRERVWFCADPGRETLAALPPGSRVVLLRSGGELAAAARLAVDTQRKATSELSAMFTHPAFRGRGHGRALLQAVLSSARGAGCTEMWLSTGDRLVPAQRLYERAGFVRQPPMADAVAGDLSFKIDLLSVGVRVSAADDAIGLARLGRDTLVATFDDDNTDEDMGPV